MDVHYLRVIAIDTSSHPSTATTTLQVNVVDANDHSPVFESASGMYEASVRESVSVGTTIITIRATDLDIGVNSQVWFNKYKFIRLINIYFRFIFVFRLNILLKVYQEVE